MNSPRLHLLGVCSLFVSAAEAFAVGAYALGAWLAFGCIAGSGLALSAAWFADRPATVSAITALDVSLAAALAETNARLKEMENRISHFGAIQTAQQISTPRRPLVSPVRPPR